VEEVIEMSTDGGFDASSDPGPISKPVITPLGTSSSSSAKSSTTSKAAEGRTIGGEEGATVDTTTASTPTPNGSIGGEEDKNEAAAEHDDEDGDDGGQDGKDGQQTPVGNGGTVEGKYVWTQTLAELAVTVPVPGNTRGRDLSVVIGRTHLKVTLKKNGSSSNSNGMKEVLVDGDLTKPIICDDSFWTVEDGNRLVINLQKQNQMEWWDSVCKGDPIIDVRKINPENSSLSDLDGETRKTVEKMMVSVAAGNNRTHDRRKKKKRTAFVRPTVCAANSNLCLSLTIILSSGASPSPPLFPACALLTPFLRLV
jgi:CS domain